MKITSFMLPFTKTHPYTHPHSHTHTATHPHTPKYQEIMRVEVELHMNRIIPPYTQAHHMIGYDNQYSHHLYSMYLAFLLTIGIISHLFITVIYIFLEAKLH